MGGVDGNIVGSRRRGGRHCGEGAEAEEAIEGDSRMVCAEEERYEHGGVGWWGTSAQLTCASTMNVVM
jgi:hypothetical protein